MIIQYGGKNLIDHEAMVTYFGSQRVYNSRGRSLIWRQRMVIEGEIVGANTAAIDTRVAAIYDTFGLDGGVCRMLQSDGTATQFVIGDGSLGGCRVIQPPSFALQDGKAHYLTGLPFTIVLEADYVDSNDTLVSYSETITKIGQGGPRRLVIELDNGTAQEQIVSAQTPVVIIQSGEAIGYLGFPLFNAAVYPNYVDLPDGFQVSYAAPRLDGNTYTEYGVRWNYRMTIPTNADLPFPSTR